MQLPKAVARPPPRGLRQNVCNEASSSTFARDVPSTDDLVMRGEYEKLDNKIEVAKSTD